MLTVVRRLPTTDGTHRRSRTYGEPCVNRTSTGRAAFACPHGRTTGGARMAPSSYIIGRGGATCSVWITVETRHIG